MSFWTIGGIISPSRTGRSACRAACALPPPSNCTLGIYAPIVTPKLSLIPGIPIPTLSTTRSRRRSIGGIITPTWPYATYGNRVTAVVKISLYATCVAIASIVSYRTRYMVDNPPAQQVKKLGYFWGEGFRHPRWRCSFLSSKKFAVFALGAIGMCVGRAMAK